MRPGQLMIVCTFAYGCHESHFDAPTKHPAPERACGSCEPGSVEDASFNPREGVFATVFEPRCEDFEQAPDRFDAWLDDSEIPEFNRRRSRVSNMESGSARLRDHELQQHLLSVQTSIFACIDLAACYDGTKVERGELDFEFELEPDGHVSAVSVDPSRELDHPVIRSCTRKSLYRFRFPSWSGARMLVSYSVEISEAGA